MATEETIIKNRLLYDTRSIKSLYGKYRQLANEAPQTIASQNQLECFMIELSLLEYKMLKHSLIHDMSVKEIQNFQNEASTKEQNILNADKEIDALKQKLLDAQQRKKNLIEYDLKSKQITRMQSRDKLISQIDQYKEEIESQRLKLKSIESAIDMRKKQFGSLISTIHELQSIIADPKLDEENDRIDDDDDLLDEDGEEDEEGAVQEDVDMTV
ncbi:hypothetical protein BC833DRAFT_581555 [Globomyces pollinis-pini]|nr:hypothetical protein BC833DRAFT_581555 [Globomyces pollinis-pini]